MKSTREKKVLETLVPLVDWVTRVGVSFSLCAPGAAKFGDPAALSSRDWSCSGVINDSTVSKPTEIPSGSLSYLETMSLCGSTPTKKPFWNMVPLDTAILYADPRKSEFP